MNEHEPILVVGAGIGGLAAALALARVGRKVIVLERRETIGEPSYGVNLSRAGCLALDALGIDPRTNPDVCRPKHLAIYRRKDSVLLRKLTLIEPHICMGRHELMAHLQRAVEVHETIEIRCGHRVMSCAVASEEGVEVETEAGRLSGSGLVLASGIHGQSLHPDVSPTPQMPIACTVFRSRVLLDRGERAHLSLYLNAGGHAVVYTIEEGRAVNFVVYELDRGSSTATGETPDLLRAFPDTLIQRYDLDQASWRRWPLLVSPIGAWQASKGPVALLGDCAHGLYPFLAQGLMMALEDAVALGKHVSGETETGSLTEAFRAYESSRQERVAMVQRESKRQGDIYHVGSLVRPLRDLALRRLPETVFRRRLGKVLAPDLTGG